MAREKAKGSDRWNFDPDLTVPGGGYECKIKKVIHDVPTSTGKMCYRVQVEITDAEDRNMVGTVMQNMFVIGTDDDPEAKKDSTLRQFGGKRFLQFAQGAGVQLDDDDDDNAAALEGQKLFIVVTRTKQASGDYAGELQNKWIDYAKVGDKDVFTDDEGNRKAKKASKKHAEPEEAEEETERPKRKKAEADEEEERPARKKGRDAEEEDAEEEDERPARKKAR